MEPPVPLAMEPAPSEGMVTLAHVLYGLHGFSALMGVLMVVGIAVSNGILLVDDAARRLEDGASPKDAILDAARSRFVPILMTSLAMALGSLPIALSLGDASTSRIPLGIVIVGGVLFSLILTLFVIPAMYSFLSRTRKHIDFDHLETLNEKSQPTKELVYET